MKKLLIFLCYFVLNANVSFAQTPNNNSVTNATEITSFPFSDNNVRIDLSNFSTGEGGCNNSSFKVVVYKFIPNENTNISLKITDSNGNNALGTNFLMFYEAPNLNATSQSELSIVSNCALNDGNNTFFVTKNTSYYVLINRVNANVETNILFTKANSVPQIEKEALLSLYNSTNGDNWTNNTNWNTTEPVSSWSGVSTININGTLHVSSLDLGNNNLSGTIPVEIGNLSNLTNLDIGSNSLTGNIPKEIGNLTKLVKFRVYFNQLQGTIPKEIGNLVNLIELDLAPNKLSGEIPTEIGNLINLEILWLNDNEFSGIIPTSLLNLKKLKKLYLKGCNYEGKLPDFSTITSLELLSIFDNNFEFGDFENEFSKYKSNLELYYSPQKTHPEIELNGSSIVNIGDSRTLTVTTSGADNVYTWYKNSEKIGESTDGTFTLSNIQSKDNGEYYAIVKSNIVTGLNLTSKKIFIGDNIDPTTTPDYNTLVNFYKDLNGANWKDKTNWLSSEPIYKWKGIVVDENNKVIELNLFSNNLSGTIPSYIKDFNELKKINFYNNLISGNIPKEVGSLNKLEFLSFSKNNLAGNIPAELGNLNKLEYISFSRNNLTGNIPGSFSNLILMASFYIYDNGLSGDISNIFSNWTNLQYFSIGEYDNVAPINSFSGNLNLSNNTKLKFYKLNYNNFSTINIQNGNNSNTTTFDVSNNPNLTCIFVDNATYSISNWSDIDTSATFLETQEECNNLLATTYIPDDNFEQALIDLGYDDVLDNRVKTSNINTITSLDVDGANKSANNKITDLTGIEDFIGLTKLICWNNNISSLDVSNNVNLVDLYTAGNPLKTLDVSKNSLLEVLYCGFNQLSTLDISKNLKLKQLGCSNNNLSSLDLSKNINLFYLVFSGNSIKTINVTHLSSLQHLVFENNQISNIDLSNNLLLTGLFCKNNLLTELDVSKNNKLYRFGCSNNYLNTLNVKNNNNSNFITFRASNNPNLTCIFVDNASYSNTNWVNIDSTASFVETQAECNILPINNEEFKNGLRIYPNPTSGLLFIDDKANTTIKKIKVLNLLGQILIETTVVKSINISYLPKGIYYLNIENENSKNAYYRIVKK